jgi:hypothetical protein
MSAETDQVQDAEQEAAEAEALAEALEERVRDGDPKVGPEDIERAKALGRFARLRQTAAVRKADSAREAARFKDCQDLAWEIEAFTKGNGTRYAELLRDVEASIGAFVGAVDERNDRVRSWRTRMQELGVPEHTSADLPPAEHAGLGFNPNRQSILVGAHEVSELPVVGYLNRFLGRVQIGLKLPAPLAANSFSPETVIEDLEAIDAANAASK